MTVASGPDPNWCHSERSEESAFAGDRTTADSSRAQSAPFRMTKGKLNREYFQRGTTG